MIASFDRLKPEQQQLAGGKGSTLARLYQAGYPVPDGFVILTTAFDEDELRPEAWAQIQLQLAQSRKRSPEMRFAVRSSALSEDSAHASFAGEFETILNARTDAEIKEAIRIVRQSRHTKRVQAYSQAQGMAETHQVAVVVQQMVQARLSGVLFTADPVTGSRSHMVGNFIHGLGEQLVSGNVNAQTFTLQRPKGQYKGPSGCAPFTRRLWMLARRLEKMLKGPQDIEWAIAGSELYLLQSRPITTLQAYNAATGEWNDSLTGDFMWTNANFGEAFPDVMTPLTWSLVQIYFKSIDFGQQVFDAPIGGNIGGRLYMNLSITLSSIRALGLSRKKLMRTGSETFGRFPSDIDIPIIPLGRWQALRYLAWALFQRVWLYNKLKHHIPFFIAKTPKQVKTLGAEIRACSTPRALLAFWQDKLQGHLEDGCRMLIVGLTEYRTLSRKLHIAFEKQLGEADANALLSGMSSDDDYLASLGPLIGLIKVSRGEMRRQEYQNHYGHRGPHEMELSIPRPSENPAWIDKQLAELQGQSIDVPAMLAEQRRRHQAAWQRLVAKVPHQARRYRKKLDRLAAAAKTRERVRSEAVRALGALRDFALRTGELTGIGQDIFFLYIEDILALLEGDRSPLNAIPARRETYNRYCALPAYPALIRGRFDPFQWAADPNRRSDFCDAQAPIPQSSADTMTGFAGAAGTVEGIVRRLDSLEESHLLQAGEILVTATTNIGWTPLFARAAAIITDVGAPFSHAAIVARELGIPAVVGCGNATMHLRTGDRVRVHGGQGLVEKLTSA